MARAGVLVFANDSVVLIERRWKGRHYFVVPGGGVEAGERPEDTAVRELREETGLEVRLGPIVARVRRHGEDDLYFGAHVVGGTFGAVDGPEFGSDPAYDDTGTYEPVWVGLDDIGAITVLPRSLAPHLAAIASAPPPQPLELEEPPG